ncbi:MAG: metal ABC transporter ATP-binding protein [Acidimicrobiia bacterium]|nr:metal ABC transporter ATP-binding protein [Acidimicrobiia bacterium]
MTSIIASGIELGYGSNTVITKSSLEIPGGRITCLIGPNGSGKSTLLNAMAGLITPNSGMISFSTISTEHPSIAYVLQSTKVNESLPVTVREVVAMGRYGRSPWPGRLSTADRAAIDRAMSRMGLEDIAGAHLNELSGGQRQRVFVAQGLAQDHEILLLDEPLTGLDLTSAQAIDAVIHDEQEDGCTIVMTTHDLAEAQVADHVVLLAGRVVASGPPDEVLTVANLTSAYGPNLLHVQGKRLFLDDPAHRPSSERHVHRDLSSQDPA